MRTAALLLLWTLFVLYPNPAHLLRSFNRAWFPTIEAQAVSQLATTLPDDPQAIERAVNDALVQYAVPWKTYGLPWYFPTAAEALANGQGDCQAQAIVLASLLQAKGIPATLVGSFDHLWVEYPGKRTTAQENGEIAIVRQQADGTYRFRWPALTDWQTSWEIERAYFWDAMPVWRRFLLLGGGLILICRKCVWQYIGSLASSCRWSDESRAMTGDGAEQA